MNMQKCYLSMHRYKAFLKVAEVDSFTKAAELLGYTQPALSQMMTSLERELSIDPPIIRTLAVGHQGPPYPGRWRPRCLSMSWWRAEGSCCDALQL